ncbi:MAG: hypothetical protein RL336_806 [Pseudomonadota bacterium]
MNPQGMPTPYADDEIDLKELFGVLWDGKVIIAAITGAAAVIAVMVALSMTNIYRSEALLMPASGGDNMGSLASKYGGLASLAGISLGGGGAGDKTTLAMEVMKSRQFLQSFIEKRDILVPLMAAEGWNRGDDTLEINDDLYDPGTQQWVRDVDPPKTAAPSLQEAHEVFTKLISLSQDKESGFVTLAIEHVSPTVAQQWVTWLVEDVNDVIRQQDVAQAERSIAYLKEQIAATSLADLQAGFFELIQKQTETIMLAKASPEYVFRTVDPAVVPEQKSKPKRALICVLGTMLGGMLGVLIVLIRHYAFKEEQ